MRASHRAGSALRRRSGGFTASDRYVVRGPLPLHRPTAGSAVSRDRVSYPGCRGAIGRENDARRPPNGPWTCRHRGPVIRATDDLQPPSPSILSTAGRPVSGVDVGGSTLKASAARPVGADGSRAHSGAVVGGRRGPTGLARRPGDIAGPPGELLRQRLGQGVQRGTRSVGQRADLSHVPALVPRITVPGDHAGTILDGPLSHVGHSVLRGRWPPSTEREGDHNGDERTTSGRCIWAARVPRTGVRPDGGREDQSQGVGFPD